MKFFGYECDLSSCIGLSIKYAPCDLWGCRTCFCFGPKCYRSFGLPLVTGLEETIPFLVELSSALEKYGEKHSIPNQMAVIEDYDGLMVDEKSTELTLAQK